MRKRVLYNGTRVLIRPQAPSDADGLWRLFSSLSGETRMLAGVPDQEELSKGDFRERMMQVVKDRNRRRYVCVVPSPCEEFIGYSGVYIGGEDRRTGWIFFYVKDAFQGRGVGWTMLKHIVDEAPSLGLGRLAARVYCENERAIKLLRRFNFNIGVKPQDPEPERPSFTMYRTVIDYSFEIVQVEGVRYRVVEQPQIRNRLFEALREEWEEDEFMEEWYPMMENWDWTVETLDIADIHLWKSLMEDPAFIHDLKKRVKVQKELMLTDETLEPLVVRGRDMLIHDGYARLQALKQLGKSEILAYVGRESRHAR